MTCTTTTYVVFEGVQDVDFQGTTVKFDWSGVRWEGPGARVATPNDHGHDWLSVLRDDLLNGQFHEENNSANPLSAPLGAKTHAEIYFAHLCEVTGRTDDVGGNVFTVDLVPEGASTPVTAVWADLCHLWVHHPNTPSDPQVGDVEWFVLGSNFDRSLGGTYVWGAGQKWPVAAGLALDLRSSPCEMINIQFNPAKHMHEGQVRWGSKPSQSKQIDIMFSSTRAVQLPWTRNLSGKLSDTQRKKRAWMNFKPKNLKTIDKLWLTKAFCAANKIPI